MQSNIIRSSLPVVMLLLITTLACNIASGVVTSTPPNLGETPTQVLIEQQITSVAATATVAPTSIPITNTVVLMHTMTPTGPRGGKLVYDVSSAGTASEKRAPYGDSYEWNRLERPFTQDMSYVPDVDISYFTVAKDNDWWYVSIKLMGVDPNNVQGIDYGVELDLDRDGFGNYLVWAHPPYTNQWDTAPVQIYQDQNHNTGGLSSGKSDAPFAGDGYETQIFDGSMNGADPDLAWVRINAEADATVQFAFKRSWAGSIFMLGVIADAGWKDPKKLDYVDRVPIAEAGSPVKENMYYPLKSLVLVDNTCREAFGFEPTHFEPQGCPVEPTPTKAPKGPPPPPGSTPAPSCPPHGLCSGDWDPVNCVCIPG